MLQVRQLEKTLDSRTALVIEALDVCAGEVVAVVGPIGSGKSLLIRLLSGVLLPSGGSVTLDGRDIHSQSAARADIGVLFEEDLLYKRQTARGNLELICSMRSLSGQLADEALALVGLSDQSKKRVEALTPTARRRLAFARMLLGRPKALLLDQPTLHTDLDTQTLFARLLTQAAADGSAVLLAEEDLSWAGKVCTRIVELEGGRVTTISNNSPRAAGTAAEEEAAALVTTPAPERLIPFKVPARKEDRVVLYDPGDLLYATSRDGKTILRTATEEATSNLTLQELESRLAGRGFFKAHRAYLVNLQHIRAVIQYTRSSYTLQLDDPQETMIPLSKQSEKELQDLLGY